MGVRSAANFVRFPEDFGRAEEPYPLEKAKLTRSELFVTDATRKNMTWHDLRATGITWLAIRGDDPLKIMQRAGHEDFRTTQGYIREAEAIRDGFGDVFPPLPPDLLGGGAAPATLPPEGGVSPGESPGNDLSMRNHGGGAGNRTQVRKASSLSSFTCVVAD